MKPFSAWLANFYANLTAYGRALIATLIASTLAMFVPMPLTAGCVLAVVMLVSWLAFGGAVIARLFCGFWAGIDRHCAYLWGNDGARDCGTCGGSGEIRYDWFVGMRKCACVIANEKQRAREDWKKLRTEIVP